MGNKKRDKEERYLRRLERKLKKLPGDIVERFREGEKVYFVYRGVFPFTLLEGNLLPPYIIFTNYRIIVADPNFPSGINYIDFPWEEVVLVRFSRGLFFGSFEFKDEKGNVRKINWAELPEPFFKLEQFCIERIQNIAVENPTVHESGRLWWKTFEIQRSPETGTRTKLQIVQSVTEKIPGKFEYSPNNNPEETIPMLDYEEAMKVINDEAQTLSDKLVVARKLYDNGVISKETYEKILKTLTGKENQENRSEENSSEE